MSLGRTRPLGRIALAIGVLLLAACGRKSIGSPSAKTPVILISIDTLRSDHLPAYGYKNVATPNIDALRADSILYERAYSHVPLTLPSHVSMLTGLLPADSGIRDNLGNRLSPSIPTVAELLKKNGYATGAAVSAFVLRHETGVSNGFDFFDDSTAPLKGGEVLGRIQRTGRETFQAGQKFLDAQSASKPFFYFLHLYDPHTPYDPPEPFFSKYPNHYDGEIAYSDDTVGSLIKELKDKGIYDDALIILLSDHGEGLNEHGEEEHGIFLYREDLQVPLLVKLPHSRRGGSSVNTPVQLVDVFPTILERTATPEPKGGHRIGQSLLSFLDGGPSRQIFSESYYARLHFGWSDLESLIDGHSHYIRAPQAELYDLSSDPGERNNVIANDRRTYTRMRAAIEPFLKEATAPSTFDPEEAAKLAALGYIGSTVETKSGEVLPDPKGKLDVFNKIRLAYTYYRNKNQPEALKLTNQLLADNARIVDLWDLKSKIIYAMGDKAGALQTAKEGLKQNPNAIAILFDVANLCLDTGDLDGAQQHAEIAARVEPGQAHEILARIAVERHKPDVAEKEARLALQTVNEPSTELMILGGVEMDRKNYPKALEYLDQAWARVQKKDPPRLVNLHMTRGEALAQMNRVDEAEKEFRAEIADFPANPRPYSSLIMLLATEGKLDAATQLVFDVVKAAPAPHTYVVVAETLKAIGDDRGALFWTYQGLHSYPQDDELRRLPRHLAEVTPQLNKHFH
ncbi:MAG TPA: sulfatase-like hydrolase/transferase [Vicinamibacterales bacterium]